MTASLTIVGLVMNLIGVILLFRYGMPYRVSQLNEGSTFDDPPTPRDTQLNRRHKRFGWTGLIAIIIGTFLQVAANLSNVCLSTI